MRVLTEQDCQRKYLRWLGYVTPLEEEIFQSMRSERILLHMLRKQGQIIKITSGEDS